ncbi:hypothetical protein THAOC_13210, partial [Thalassiosira oceanica]
MTAPTDGGERIAPDDHTLNRVFGLLSGVGASRPSMTELDSHANWSAFGDDSTDLVLTGRTVQVQGYDPSQGHQSLSIRHKAVAHDCPYTGRTFICIANNSLHLNGARTNLIPPVLLREAGLIVNDTLKQHVQDPSSDDHCIICPTTNQKIHLELNGTFSGFRTRALTQDEIDNIDDYEIIWLTPNVEYWDPYDPEMEYRENRLLDEEGNVKMLGPGERRPSFDAKGRFLAEIAEISNLIGGDEEEEDEDPPDVTAEEYERLVSQVCSLHAAFEDPASTTRPTSGLNGADDGPQISIAAIGEPDSFEPNPATAIGDDALLNEALQLNQERIDISTALGSLDVDQWDDDLFRGVGELIANGEYTLGALDAGRAGGTVSAEDLSKLWQVRVQDAERTVNSTTQRHPQNYNTTITRQRDTNDRMLRYRRLLATFFTDTMIIGEKYKSTRQYRFVQVFVSDTGFIFVYFMRAQRDYLSALRAFSKEVGAPDILVCDPHPTQKSKDVHDYCNKIGTRLRVLEERTQWADLAELYIGILKDSVRKDLRASGAPLVLWDYCMERRAAIYNVTARDDIKLGGQTPHARMFGDTPDISNLVWGWYDWVYYRDNKSFPRPREVLGRVLGPAKNQGNEMAQYVLQINGKVVIRRTFRRLRPDELAASNEVESRRRSLFDHAIEQLLGTSYSNNPILPENRIQAKLEDVLNDEQLKEELPYTLGEEGSPTHQSLIFDPADQAQARGLCKVLRTAVDKDGKVIGNPSEHPQLNTVLYDVQCWDGKVRQYAANVIAENILSQVDTNGRVGVHLRRIADHKREADAVRREELTGSKKSKLRFTTRGWKFKVLWSDGSYEWIHLSDLKESNPVDVAEYAKSRDLVTEPAFAWWVPYTLRKKTAILKAVNSRVCKNNVKYGVRVPRTLKEARRFDKENGNDHWEKAYKKEMKNVGIAFRVLAEGERAPAGYTKASGHLIFDVKMDFTRKARWVKDGHRTPDLETSSYAGVVSRESVRVLLTYAALHDIPVCAADIRNAYLSAKSSEKHYIICGPEFGLENEGRVAIIERALYGGKAAGRDYWHHLRNVMKNKLGFTSSRGDPDVWFRESRRNEGGEPYYEYVLIYTDDILVLSDNAEAVLREELGSGFEKFELKEESIGPPSQYLGGKLSLVTTANNTKAWQFSSSQYVQEAVRNVEKYLAATDRILPRRCTTPLSPNYRPEIDTTLELNEVDDTDAAFFHSLIGMLRWIVELGRADICLEVSLLSHHLALPREGHFAQALHIFGYLREHHNAAMVFDPAAWDVPATDFQKKDWNYSVYGCDGLTEELPADMPTPLGKTMRMHVYVDSDHAGDSVTRRSRTGFVVFLNSAPIFWFSKRQTSCETSTFG